MLYEGPGAGNAEEQLKVLRNLRQHHTTCWAHLKHTLFQNLVQRADVALVQVAGASQRQDSHALALSALGTKSQNYPLYGLCIVNILGL